MAIDVTLHFNGDYASIVGSVVECSPATRAARVRFPDDADFFLAGQRPFLLEQWVEEVLYFLAGPWSWSAEVVQHCKHRLYLETFNLVFSIYRLVSSSSAAGLQYICSTNIKTTTTTTVCFLS